MDLKALWDRGMTFQQFVAVARPEYRPLWEGVYRVTRLPAWAGEPVAGHWRLLVLAEDWCADTSSTIPVLARWVERHPKLSLRILRRDEHPELMDRYLTNGTRSIPVVLVLDEQDRVVGHWGPYPGPLGAWVRDHKPPRTEKAEFVKFKRTWYAKDRGETTLCEVAALLGAAEPVTCSQP